MNCSSVGLWKKTSILQTDILCWKEKCKQAVGIKKTWSFHMKTGKSCCFAYFRSVSSGNYKCYRQLRYFYIFTVYSIKLLLIAIFKRTHLQLLFFVSIRNRELRTESGFYIKVIEAGVLLNCSCKSPNGQKLMQSSAQFLFDIQQINIG